MKKVLFAILLTTLFFTGGSLLHMRSASAATSWQINFWNNYCAQGAWGAGCKGYYTGVKPGCIPNICNTFNVLSTGVNVGGAPTGCGPGTACDNFITTVQNALYSGGPARDSCGGAFIVNAMLGHVPFPGGCAAGIAAAEGPGNATFNGWKALVQSYANSSNPAYGVQWDTLQNPTINSSWFANNPGYPNNISDEISHANIWHCTVNGCGGTYRDDATTGWIWRTVNVPIPVIRFYFPGGSFMIERGCANLVGIATALPTVPVNRPPVGTLVLRCDASLEQQVATVTFSDPDGPTTGYIVAGSWTSGTSNGPGPLAITIPQSAVSPYSTQPVSLFVKDTGPSGTQQYQAVATANTQVPCATLGCGSMTVTPARLDPYMRFSIDTAVTNNVNQTPSGATMKIAITPPSGASFTYASTQPATGTGSVSTATFSGIGPTGAAGVYTVTWTLQWTFGGRALSKTCTGTLPVVYLPYLSIYGGDAAIGDSPSQSTGASACMSNQSAGIYGWNNDTTTFSGAGSQYAVQALAQIEDFASGQGSSTSPTGLSFANSFFPPDANKVNPSQGLFGGFFGATTGDCDFTSDITTAPVTSPVTLGATMVGIGTQDVWYVKGANVYISGNIAYAGTGGWASVGDIPYFKLVVVGGNIYIGNNVTQLDGIYVAESDGSKGGAIYTCATGMGQPIDLTTPTAYGICNNKLTINGAFVAAQVQFERTFGSVGQANLADSVTSNHAAEVFNYTPELWLPRSGVKPKNTFSAITGLPPVL